MSHSFASRKGVGTALGAVFFITLAIMSITAMWAISFYEARYQRVREEMNDFDVQRISENLNVKAVENSTHAGYAYDIVEDNLGGVTVNVARIYVYDQNTSALKIYDPQTELGYGFTNGTIAPGEANHRIPVKGEPLNETHEYRIILATDRGRQFSVTKTPVRERGAPMAGKGEATLLVVTFNLESFQYKDIKHDIWTSAWSKPRSMEKEHPLYRVNITNTGSKDIELKASSIMEQIKVGEGETSSERYICSEKTDVHNNNPTPFVYQRIPAYSWRYVYFAGKDIDMSKWVDDPAPSAYHVSFVIYFNYVGENDIFIIYVTDIIQEIK